MRKYLLFIIVLFGCTITYAQDKPKGPDLQTIDDGFFDPTKEEKVVEDYHFGVEYRIEAGYVQNWQWSNTKTYPDLYLHGGRIGATFTFLLPRHFSVQTGVLYSLAGNTNTQYYGLDSLSSDLKQNITNTILEHNLVIPVRAFVTIPVWKQLNLCFYAGPQLQIGLAQQNKVKANLGDVTAFEGLGIHTSDYDKLQTQELTRANIQFGIGGGLEWDRYRLQAGYDFGLNNMIRTKIVSNQHMWEWGWYVSFCYKL